MERIRFTRSGHGTCPTFRDYYIQDRFSGKDIYGNDTYQYALFRRLPFVLIRRFRTRKQGYSYLSELTGLSRWDVQMGSSAIIINDRNYLGVIHGASLFRFSRKTRELAVRPQADEQLTGWYDRYADCLAGAKELIVAGCEPAERTAI